MPRFPESKKLVCAPMATLSHEAFRRAIARFGGCDEYFTEMINAASLLNFGPFERFYLLSGPEPEKIVWQLTGSDGDKMAAAAEMLCAQGGIGIDINMGCSAPAIWRTGAGIAWMTRPVAEAESMLRKVKAVLEKNAPSMRLSVKFRLGDEDFNSGAEGERKFLGFAQMLCDCGASLLTLHARTKKERYRGRPRWKYVQRLAEAARPQGIAVYLNGCVDSPESADAALRIAPDCDGLAIARAAAQRPWIFAELRGLAPETADLRQIALDYIDDVQKYQPPEFWKTRIQRFFAYFCQNFSFSHYAASQILNGKNPDDFKSRLDSYLEKQPDDRLKVLGQVNRAADATPPLPVQAE